MHVLSGVLGSAANAKTVGAATAAGAATTAGAASGAFKYNRANYMFDNAQRFSRYTSGYSFAISQASMYREDIRDLTALTVSKQDLYHVVGVIFFVLNFQLIMAGRLGVHGPSPPGWLLGLYWGNVCTALMFLCLYNWLAMHASARAQAGGAHMLTRNVRLPIPTPKQLDKARRTGNSFERARVTDMFRVPFVAPAPKDATLEDGSGESDGSYSKKSKAGKATTPSKKRNIPRWYQSDETADLYGGGSGPAPTSGSTPEHFELYRGLQEEWWAHDVYARVGMLFFMSHWLTSASLYTQCHAFGELRALWPAWSCSAIFCTAHAAILKLDIVVDVSTRSFNFPVEKLLPWTPMVAVLGMTLDYSIIEPTIGWKSVIYVLSWICYGIHLAWAWRLYDLAAPKLQEETPEAPGQPWWPMEWQVPPAFQNCVYLVAPPKRLEPGQTCLQQEMKAAKGGKGATIPHKKTKQASVPAHWPWRVFRGAIFTTTAMWVFICCGRVIEQINGERMFLKQEGRVVRWPSHMQPWMTPWSRLGTRNEYCHTGGCDRRLSVAHGQQQQTKIAAAAQRLAAVLGPIAEGLERPLVAKRAVAPLRTPLHQVEVSWPAQLEPVLLASSSSGTVALAHGNRGALLRLQIQPGTGATVLDGTSAFFLQGVEGCGDLLGASWGEAGLLLTTTTGALAECAGMPVNGLWPCKQVGGKLPAGGSSITMAAAARVPSTGRLRAAVTLAGESSIVLFDEDDKGGAWLPVGEVRAPQPVGKLPSFSMSSVADELIISLGHGGVLQWAIGQPEPTMVVAPQAVHGTTYGTSYAVSRLGSHHLAHLKSKKQNSVHLMPELLVSVH